MARQKERLTKRTNVEPAPALSRKPPVDWRPHAFTVLTVLALALAAYANSFSGDLSFDSKVIVEDDPRIRAATGDNLRLIWSKGYWYNNQDSELYRPLTTLSYLFNYSVLGNHAWPAGYHWVNFLLHAINVVLVYGLGLVIFGDRARAAALAALWAVHPVLTESVTNIVGRADLLAAMAVLGGLLCHGKAAATTGRRRLGWLVALAVISAAGMASKESAIVLIAVLVAYDLAYRRRVPGVAIASYAAVVVPVLAFLYRRWQVLSTIPLNTTEYVNNPLTGLDFWHSRLTAIQVMGRYLGLILWPARLSCDYSFNQIPLFQGTFNHWGDWVTLIGLAACLVLGAAAVIAYRRRIPVVLFLLIFFMVALAPVANIVIRVGTIMAERFLYLPAVGLIGCAVWAIYAGAGKLNEKRPQALVNPLWVAGVLCLCLAIRTHARNVDWESGLALFESAVKVSSNSYKSHMNLGILIYPDKAKVDGAIAQGERTLAILAALPADQVVDASPWANVGLMYRSKGDVLYKDAAPGSVVSSRGWYGKSLSVLLEGVAADRKYAAACARQNRMAGRPAAIYGFPSLYQELGVTYERLGEDRKALEALDYGIYVKPGPELLQLETDAYTALGDADGAAISLMEGVLLFPDEKGFPSELLALYQKQPGSCAIERTGGNASLNMGCPEVHEHLCAGARRVRELYERRGEQAEAVKAATMATQSLGCPAE